MLRQIGVCRVDVLVGAGDFSPPTVMFSGLKSRAPKDLRPRQIALSDKEGGWLQNGVDNAVRCEIFGTHVVPVVK